MTVAPRQLKRLPTRSGETQIVGTTLGKLLLTVSGFVLIPNGSVTLPRKFTEADDELRSQQIQLPNEESQTIRDLLCTRLPV